MKFYWYTALIFGLVLGAFIYMSDNHFSRRTSQPASAVIANCDMSTPRAAVRSFLQNVRNYNRDRYSGFQCVANIITAPGEQKTASYESDVFEKAKKLFLILENINYDLDTDIPDNVSGDRAVFTLKIKDRIIKIVMVRGNDGWHFAREMFTDQTFVDVVNKLKHKYDKFTSENMEGDTFVQSLMSPYRTFFTLKSGVEGKGQNSLDRAVSTLDLSYLTALEQPVYGPILAIILYRVITERSTIHLEQLSADPDCDYPPVFLVVPDLGSITMHVVTLPNGRKAWKFTPESLNVAWKSYDDTIQDLLKEGADPFIGEQLPLHMDIDDFVHRHYPNLIERYLNTNIYKWVILLGLFLLTPVVPWLISFAGNRILNVVEKNCLRGLPLLNALRLYCPYR